MKVLACSLVSCLLLTVSPFAHALDTSMSFTFHDPCGGGNSEICAPVMLGRGVIDASTVSKFKSALSAHQTRLKLSGSVAGISSLVLQSSGGLLSAGLELGNEIRRLKIDTRAVAELDEHIFDRRKREYAEVPLIRNGKCLSACAYAFIGGNKRAVEAEKVLGVHQFRSVNGATSTEGEVQALTATLSMYVQKMGISPQFMTIASLTKPDQITYLGLGISRKLNIDNLSIARSPWSITATRKGLPILRVSQPLNSALEVQIDIVRNGTDVLVASTTKIDFRRIGADRVAQFPELEKPIVMFFVDGQVFKGIVRGGWRKEVSNDVLAYTALSVFSVSFLSSLSSAQKVRITDDFGRATSDISIDTNLSTDGLSSGVALLMRSQ